MSQISLEIIYILAGIISLATAYHAISDKDHPSPVGTALFWSLLGVIFCFGKYLPPSLVGAILLFMGTLTALKKVKFGSQANASEKERVAHSNRIGNKLFIPAVSIGIIAFIFGQFISSLGGLVGLGVGAVCATLIALRLTKVNVKYVSYDGGRLLQQVGSASILPQLLAALGALFAVAGVGDTISNSLGGLLSGGGTLVPIILYCFGMMIFTVIMGNAFAAFAVITTGIGVPFIISQGGNPAVVGILGLTAGYCGTLMTPMAANFNIVPSAILETKNRYRVIISQVPYAISLWVVHVILMYILAF